MMLAFTPAFGMYKKPDGKQTPGDESLASGAAFFAMSVEDVLPDRATYATGIFTDFSESSGLRSITAWTCEHLFVR